MFSTYSHSNPNEIIPLFTVTINKAIMMNKITRYMMNIANMFFLKKEKVYCGLMQKVNKRIY